ncbi:hypothetical protein GCM10022197_22870 [Microlunatus spumicola]|uniref:Uncharacterized protein n=1 Tax=Microlunatus spumicola TaxID=81499 RepID=A0ABP6XHQ3_9ACTN
MGRRNINGSREHPLTGGASALTGPWFTGNVPVRPRGRDRRPNVVSTEQEQAAGPRLGERPPGDLLLQAGRPWAAAGRVTGSFESWSPTAPSPSGLTTCTPGHGTEVAGHGTSGRRRDVGPWSPGGAYGGTG